MWACPSRIYWIHGYRTSLHSLHWLQDKPECNRAPIPHNNVAFARSSSSCTPLASCFVHSEARAAHDDNNASSFHRPRSVPCFAHSEARAVVKVSIAASSTRSKCPQPVSDKHTLRGALIFDLVSAASLLVGPCPRLERRHPPASPRRCLLMTPPRKPITRKPR